ncbi:MAG: bifunctional DNA-formamidopyrimidine glycosylase/DNA-(apurinic or apyrimidinic site) lyase [Ktedonobacteraceae bacterium]|nr:bifunctional DNA-formamidopyrimidine glycosylase/DNA-(apurinic or apyrimidinic site) lyase [Ktedonobacteraceae bacterium]
MPELPEVEYTARQLRSSIVGATIEDVAVFWERSIGYPAVTTFCAQIAGRQIEQVRRRGKYLLLDLSGGYFLSIHRRMSGNLLLLSPGWQVDCSLRERDPAAWQIRGPAFFTTTGELYYCRVCFNFTDGRRLLFIDPRKFGRIELWPREQEERALRGLGPEPLDSTFTAAELRKALEGRKGAIKQLLLDQRVVAGVGNIYADEALYQAGIHPLRRADSLTSDEIESLHKGIVTVLTLGIEHGGTSFNDYRDLWGEAGENYSHMRVYHQQGRPCARCGSLIERIVVAQRSTHFCPGCQRLSAPAPLSPPSPLRPLT